ncbi:hypothetical protein GCM10009675_27760 [Prauserella alba]|uniref:Uncharacterized protein n=1 Tax=Prauserella alba TaxID=176898 RepID=A0ABP4FYQ0_9PSEU
MCLDEAEELVTAAQRNHEGFLGAARAECGPDGDVAVGEPEVPHVGAWQPQQRIVGPELLVRQVTADDEDVHRLVGFEAQAQHDPARGELVLDALGDAVPFVEIEARFEFAGFACGLRGDLVVGAGDHEADVEQRLHVALLPQQVGVGPVQRDEADAHGDDDRPGSGRALDDQVAGQARGGIDEADDEDARGETDDGADLHAPPQDAHRGHREDRARQRCGERARQRRGPRHAVGLAERGRHDVGDRERARDLDEERTGVVQHTSGDAACEQGRDTGHDVRGQHHFERRDEEADDQRYLGEGDRPRDAAAHVHVDAELFGGQERRRQQRADPPQVHRALERLPLGDRDGAEYADGQNERGVETEPELVPARRRRSRRPGGFGTGLLTGPRRFVGTGRFGGAGTVPAAGFACGGSGGLACLRARARGRAACLAHATFPFRNRHTVSLVGWMPRSGRQLPANEA